MTLPSVKGSDIWKQSQMPWDSTPTSVRWFHGTEPGDEILLEAWERMTYGGVNGVNATDHWTWVMTVRDAILGYDNYQSMKAMFNAASR